MERATRVRSRPRRNVGLQVADRLSVSSDLVYLVWRHKLWWMVPLLVAMVVLAVLVVLGPAALLARLFGARLLDLESRPGSTWLVRSDAADQQTLGGLRRQF